MNLTLRQRLRLAIHDPGAVAGRKRGPSWPSTDEAHSEEEESIGDWTHRAVCKVVWPELVPSHIYLVTWSEGDEAAKMCDLPSLARWPGDRYFAEKDQATRAGLYGYVSQELALRQQEPSPGFDYERELSQIRQRLTYRRTAGGEEWAEQLYEHDMPTGLHLRRIRLHRSTTVDPPPDETAK